MLPFIVIQTSFFLLPLLFFFIFKRKNKETIVRVIFIYVVYCILQEFLTYLFSFTFPPLRNYLFYLFASYTIIEFGLFCAFYYYLFPKEHPARRIVTIIGSSFVVFAIVDLQFINQTKQFDSFVSGVEALILILLCGYYLYHQITTTLSMFVYRTFNFWIIVTFLMYVSATFFLYLMTDAMGEDPEFQKYYLIINMSANILKNILLCFAISRKHVISPVAREDSPQFTLDLGDNEVVFQKNY